MKTQEKIVIGLYIIGLLSALFLGFIQPKRSIADVFTLEELSICFFSKTEVIQTRMWATCSEANYECMVEILLDECK